MLSLNITSPLAPVKRKGTASVRCVGFGVFQFSTGTVPKRKMRRPPTGESIAQFSPAVAFLAHGELPRASAYGPTGDLGTLRLLHYSPKVLSTWFTIPASRTTDPYYNKLSSTCQLLNPRRTNPTGACFRREAREKWFLEPWPRAYEIYIIGREKAIPRP